MSTDEFDNEDISDDEYESEGPDSLDDYSEEELEDWESYIENITKDG
jgi:hypothetical protein